MNKTKQRLGMAGIIIVILLIVGGSLYAYFATRKETTEEQEAMTRGGNGQQFAGMGDMVTVAGTTAIGMDAVIFDIDFLENASLYVEEVYLSNGDTVEAGDKVFKLTGDSIADAREELQNTAKNAELSYRSSVITTNQSRIQAKYTYETALLEAEQAEQVYNDTVAEQQASLDKTKAAYEDAQTAYNEFYEIIVNNSLRELYEVDEKKAAYEETHELYTAKVAEWEVTEEELENLSQETVAQKSGGMQQNKGMDKDTAYRNSIIKTVQLLKEADDEAQKEYEQAESDYKKALETAELDLKTLLNQYETAREDYEDANLLFQKQSASAKTTYELAVAKKETAKTDYDTTLTGLNESLEKLKDAKEEADENLALFEELVGDGYFYTTEAGTILMTRVSENQALAGDDMLFAYSNPAEVTVSVSVSQDDIAKLAVGDTATVMISEAGNYTGTITTINPVAASDSRTAVTYTVQLSIEGDVSAIEANQTANVIFGEVQMPKNGGGRGERPQGTGRPEGMERPEGAESFGRMGEFEGAESSGGMERPSGFGNRQQTQGGAGNE